MKKSLKCIHCSYNLENVNDELFSNLHGILKVNLVIWKSYLVIWEIIVRVVILKDYWLIHFLRGVRTSNYTWSKRGYVIITTSKIRNSTAKTSHPSPALTAMPTLNPNPTHTHPHIPHLPISHTYLHLPTSNTYPHILNTSHLPNHTVFLTKWSTTYFSIQYLFFEK